MSGVWRDSRVGAFGNALGQALVDAAGSPGYSAEEMAGDYQRENNRFASGAAAARPTDDGGVYLSRAQEERLMSGRTVTDYGDNYADGDGLLAGSADGVRRAGGDRLLVDRDKLSIEELEAAVAGGMAVLRRNELARAQANSDLQQDAFRRFEIEQMNAAGAMSGEVAGSGLTIRTSFPFREQLPEGGFFRGLVLGQSASSVLDAHQPGFAENLGAGVRGLVLSPINAVTGLVGEVGSQYSDMYNLLSRPESFTPSSGLLNSLQREGIGGTLLNMGHSVLSAPTKPIFDLLDGNFEQAGAGLPGLVATGLGVTGGLRRMRLGAEALPKDLIGPRLGASGFSSTSELAGALFSKYQGFVDDAYGAALQAEAAGRLKFPQGVPRETYLGQLVDKAAREDLRAWLSSESISEGAGGVVQLNRRLYNPARDSYRIPDVRVGGANVVFDATLGEKWLTTPQVQDFSTFTQGGRTTIVRPTLLGGSYSIWP